MIDCFGKQVRQDRVSRDKKLAKLCFDWINKLNCKKMLKLCKLSLRKNTKLGDANFASLR